MVGHTRPNQAEHGSYMGLNRCNKRAHMGRILVLTRTTHITQDSNRDQTHEQTWAPRDSDAPTP